MDSLTTAYLVCMLIGSTCAVGGALAGNKAAPIDSSATTSTPVVNSKPAPTPKVEVPAPPKVFEPTQEQINKLKSELTKSFGDETISNSIIDRKSTRLNSSHLKLSRMPSSA